MPRIIYENECIGCGTCQRVCLVGCIKEGENRKRRVDITACVDCGACQFACPKKCILEQE